MNHCISRPSRSRFVPLLLLSTTLHRTPSTCAINRVKYRNISSESAFIVCTFNLNFVLVILRSSEAFIVRTNTVFAKSFAAFVISHISPLEENNEISIFFKRCVVKTSSKISVKKFLLTSPDDFSIFNTNDLCRYTVSHHNEDVSENLCFIIEACSYNLRRGLHGASFEKSRNFIVFLEWGYMRNNKCRKTFGTTGYSSDNDFDNDRDYIPDEEESKNYVHPSDRIRI